MSDEELLECVNKLSISYCSSGDRDSIITMLLVLEQVAEPYKEKALQALDESTPQIDIIKESLSLRDKELKNHIDSIKVTKKKEPSSSKNSEGRFSKNSITNRLNKSNSFNLRLSE